MPIFFDFLLIVGVLVSVFVVAFLMWPNGSAEIGMSNMNTETETKTIETLLTNAPKGCAETAQLYSWATNYDVKIGTPFGLFLDLIGFTAEYLSAEPLVKNPNEFMGYLELDMLAKALAEYAERPNDVENFCSSLIVAELGL